MDSAIHFGNMSVPPLVCSTPPPPDHCEDDVEDDEFSFQYTGMVTFVMFVVSKFYLVFLRCLFDMLPIANRCIVMRSHKIVVQFNIFHVVESIFDSCLLMKIETVKCKFRQFFF